jgi:mRNA interferase RelE/StbE
MWNVKFGEEALKDYEKLDGSQRKIVNKAIKKVSQNPLPTSEGGYGKPLGNLNNTNLTGLMKIKIKSCGIRIAYKLEYINEEMYILVIGMRADEEVYKKAEKRYMKIKINK